MKSVARRASPLFVGGRQVMSSRGVIEPSVFGVFRPVLLLPKDIQNQLSEEQLRAIIAHEICHIRRRDNLLSSIHMIVAATFWFYPLVWWLGTRLLDERERACDEDVLNRGVLPEVYAEGILRVCKLYLESPLPCAPGVSGSHLQRRIQRIMSHGPVRMLGLKRACVLTTAAIALLAAPILSGVFGATTRVQGPQEKLFFEVASVKVNKSGDRVYGTQYLPGGRFSATNIPIFFLLLDAYDVTFQRLAPAADLQKNADRRVLTDRYDIQAVAQKGAITADPLGKTQKERLRLMLQNLLADRFKLSIHREMKEQPIYAIVIGKNGPKLQKATIEEKDCPDEMATPTNGIKCHSFAPSSFVNGLHGDAVDMSDVARALSAFSDRPVIDKTGLRELYNVQTAGWVDLRNVSRPARPAETDGQRAEDQAVADPSRPTAFAVFEELGLKLESQTGPVEIIVVDHLEPPAEN